MVLENLNLGKALLLCVLCGLSSEAYSIIRENAHKRISQGGEPHYHQENSKLQPVSMEKVLFEEQPGTYVNGQNEIIKEEESIEQSFALKTFINSQVAVSKEDVDISSEIGLLGQGQIEQDTVGRSQVNSGSVSQISSVNNENSLSQSQVVQNSVATQSQSNGLSSTLSETENNREIVNQNIQNPLNSIDLASSGASIHNIGTIQAGALGNSNSIPAEAALGHGSFSNSEGHISQIPVEHSPLPENGHGQHPINNVGIHAGPSEIPVLEVPVSPPKVVIGESTDGSAIGESTAGSAIGESFSGSAVGTPEINQHITNDHGTPFHNIPLAGSIIPVPSSSPIGPHLSNAGVHFPGNAVFNDGTGVDNLSNGLRVPNLRTQQHNLGEQIPNAVFHNSVPGPQFPNTQAHIGNNLAATSGHVGTHISEAGIQNFNSGSSINLPEHGFGPAGQIPGLKSQSFGGGVQNLGGGSGIGSGASIPGIHSHVSGPEMHVPINGPQIPIGDQHIPEENIQSISGISGSGLHNIGSRTQIPDELHIPLNGVQSSGVHVPVNGVQNPSNVMQVAGVDIENLGVGSGIRTPNNGFGPGTQIPGANIQNSNIPNGAHNTAGIESGLGTQSLSGGFSSQPQVPGLAAGTQSHIPQSQSNVPGFLPQLPAIGTQVPGFGGNNPGALEHSEQQPEQQHIPGVSTQLPGVGGQVPGFVANNPGSQLHIPGHSEQQPGSQSHILGVSAQLPGVGGQVPGFVANNPGSQSHIPGHSGQQPGLQSHIPGASAQLPAVGAQVPATGEHIPESKGHTPLGSQNGHTPSVQGNVDEILIGDVPIFLFSGGRRIPIDRTQIPIIFDEFDFVPNGRNNYDDEFDYHRSYGHYPHNHHHYNVGYGHNKNDNHNHHHRDFEYEYANEDENPGYQYGHKKHHHGY